MFQQIEIIMAVRSQHARQSKNYIIENINGMWYYITKSTYQSKSLIYHAKKKLANGTLNAPQEIKNIAKTILVTCEGGGVYNFEVLTKK